MSRESKGRATVGRLGGGLLAILLAGCGGFRPVVTHLDQVGADEVAVIGRVRVAPPLAKGETNILHGIGGGWLHDAYLGVGDRPWPADLPPPNSTTAPNHSVLAPWDQWFIVRMPRHDFYVQGLMYYTSYSSHITGGYLAFGELVGTGEADIRRADLPAGFKIKVLPTDRVIFIGTYVFRRNEFNQPKGIRILDDVREARRVEKERLGVTRLRDARPEGAPSQP